VIETAGNVDCIRDVEHGNGGGARCLRAIADLAVDIASPTLYSAIYYQGTRMQLTTNHVFDSGDRADILCGRTRANRGAVSQLCIIIATPTLHTGDR
jgi:hypothetical protein